MPGRAVRARCPTPPFCLPNGQEPPPLPPGVATKFTQIQKDEHTRRSSACEMGLIFFGCVPTLKELAQSPQGFKCNLFCIVASMPPPPPSQTGCYFRVLPQGKYKKEEKVPCCSALAYHRCT